MIIETLEPAEATGAAAEYYRDDLEHDGVVFAHTRAMALNPEAYHAFEQLASAVVASIGPRTYELATIGAALGVGSKHCLLAHGKKVLARGLLDEEQLLGLLGDPVPAGLSPADLAVVAYAAKVSRDPAAMTDADSFALREHGLTDRQILDVTLTAAARNYFSRAIQALAVPVEEVPGLPRPIADRLLAAAEHR